jgi:ADP-ribosylglycohydrolase
LIKGNGNIKLEDLAESYIDWHKNSSPRAPGYTCVMGIQNVMEGKDPAESGLKSAGNGVAMRIAPVGLAAGENEDAYKSYIPETVMKISNITHKDYRAAECGMAVAFAVHKLIYDAANEKEFDEKDFLGSLRNVMFSYEQWLGDKYEEVPEEDKMTSLIDKVESVLDKPLDEAVEVLGNGGFVCETVPLALYCFLKNKDSYQDAVVDAVNAGGDTDTTACITGALAGAKNGVEAIPKKWLDSLQEAEEFEFIIHSLYRIGTNHI